MATTQTQRLPEWKTMYDKYRQLDYGEQVTYADLDRCLMNGSIQGKKRYVFEQFKKQMLREENKALENIFSLGGDSKTYHRTLGNRIMIRSA